ncbi:MAG TPA: hypothetical protein VF334_12215 [Polyangia bacterium]
MIALAALATAGTARADRRWVRANFHAHCAAEHVEDDGSESAAELHRAVRAAGFDVSVHSPHSNSATRDAEARFQAQRAEEAKLDVPGLSIAVGEELTVVDGPHFARRTTVLGRPAPGNLNHMTLIGNAHLVAFRTVTPAEACDRVHADGGICIVNHPGPGPMMWEEGYWETPQNRARIDALEVYNGTALATVGIDFEIRYREATAYRGLGIKIAATTGADTHGPRSVARAQAHLASIAGNAGGKLLQLLLPQATTARPELGAATLVDIDDRGDAVAATIAAVKARRTVATWALPGLHVDVDGLGEVRHSRDVKLAMKLSRKLAEVTLYREGVAVKTWHDVDAVTWSETIAKPAAYVFGARDGGGKLMTSAIWYEPPK